jgi:sulfocyanin
MLARGAAAVALLFLLLLGSARAQSELHPSWLMADAGAKRTRIDIIAGYNANNGALNFNGYFTGDMTIVVPVGWTVEVEFKNNDAMLPHSLLVTKPYPRDHVPEIAGVNEVAIPRAYTNNPDQGIPAPKGDKVSFKAQAPGDYWFFCGAPGHGQGGMWTKFKIDAAASAPSVTIAQGAEAGRP